MATAVTINKRFSKQASFYSEILSCQMRRTRTPLKKPKIVSGLSGLSRFCFILIRFIRSIR
jgi:hypothetical protein